MACLQAIPVPSFSQKDRVVQTFNCVATSRAQVNTRDFSTLLPEMFADANSLENTMVCCSIDYST